MPKLTVRRILIVKKALCQETIKGKETFSDYVICNIDDLNYETCAELNPHNKFRERDEA